MRAGAWTIASAVAVFLAGALPASASAMFGFSGDLSVQVLDEQGDPYALAGGHPEKMIVKFSFATDQDGLEGNPKEIVLDLPPGFSGDPNAVDACPRTVFESSAFSEGTTCPSTSRVGRMHVALQGGGEAEEFIYSVAKAPGQLAVQAVPLFGRLGLVMHLRPDDFGLSIEMSDLVQSFAIREAEVELWGIPADHNGDPDEARRPFIAMPSRCDQGPLEVTARARSWQEPERWIAASGSTGQPLTGCDTLELRPELDFDLTSHATDSPSGASIALVVPQPGGAEERASAAIASVAMSLPEGISISPGSVAGLAVCSDAELRRGLDAAAGCPPESRVGTLELEAPQLSAPLGGSVYLGAESPGERFRLFFVAEGDGLSVKFVGVIRTDRGSGPIEIALANLPQVGFSRMSMHFDEGPGALLTTPMACGNLTAAADFSRYDGMPAVGATAAAEIVEGAGGRSCSVEQPFSPSFSGGTIRARAGGASGLTMTLRRRSGEQLVHRFDVVLPRGLSASIGSASTCPEQAVPSASCPTESRVGSAVGEVGSGGDTAAIGADVYLTGPYRRAPFGLALAFRAVVGRFDLGTVVVRAALRIDPDSGRVSVQTDALPEAIEGFPIRFQTIGLDVDRADFIRAPTSCEPASLTGDATSSNGVKTTLSSPFRVQGCRSLRFAPRLSLRLGGAGQLRRDGRPSVRIAVRPRPGDANLRGIEIGLPPLLRRDLGGLQAICARQDAREGRCAAESEIGSATAVTPLFRRKATGSVNIVQPAKNGPPELWATLDAEGARLTVRGSFSTRGGRVYARLARLPDIPFSRLAITLGGGDRGLFELASNPCAEDDAALRAKSALEGQNHTFLVARDAVGRPSCGDLARRRDPPAVEARRG